MKNREFSLPIRGEITRIFGNENTLSIATVHREGLATPLYNVDLVKGEMSTVQIPVPLTATTHRDTVFYGAGNDNKIYTVSNKTCDVLCTLKEEIKSLKIQEQLFALTKTALYVIDCSSGKTLDTIALEKATAFDIDPSEKWLAIGFEDGKIQAFNREETKKFTPGESAVVHNTAVSNILFDRQELQVISSASDKKLMMTQLRGQLEVSERNTKGHEGIINSLIPGPENCFYSAAEDATVKLWAGGYNHRNASTTKSERAVKAISFWKMADTNILAIADDRSYISLMPLDAKNKATSASHRIYPIDCWARREFLSIDTRLREAALKELAEFPERFSINTICDQALKDSDSRLRTIAAGLLFGMDHEGVDENLAKLFKSLDKEVYIAAFKHLMSRQKLGVLDIVQRAIWARHKDLGLLAITVLADLAKSDTQAMDRLIEVLEDKTIELRLTAFDYLEKLNDKDPVQAIILGLKSKKPDVRCLALSRGFHRELLQKNEFLRLIRRHLDDSSMEVRYTSFILSLQTRPPLAEVLRSMDEDIQRRLHELDGKAAGKVKAVAIKALTESERAPLVEAMATPALDICLAGAQALASIKDPRAFGVLLQLSREAEESTRMAVCKAFRSLGDANAIPRLRLMLHDSKINVADAAFTALSTLLKETPLLLIEAGLNAPDKKIRLRAIALIARLLKKDKSCEQSISYLEKALNDRDTSVRREAFKTLLNADIYEQRADTLRFALRSTHSDIRREVLLELESQKKQSWALEVIGEMLNDADRAIRSECFNLLRQNNKDTIAVYHKALDSRFDDVRRQVLDLLLKSKKKDDSVFDMIFGRLDDESLAIRRQALDGLIENQCMKKLQLALKSEYLDVRVGAAGAQAAYGIKSALQPLLEVINSEEPKEEKGEWKNSVKAAIRGVAALGDDSAYKDLCALIIQPKGFFIKEAAEALRFCVRENNREGLTVLFANPDKAVKRSVGLAMAAIGDERSNSEVFSSKNEQSLCAAFMLRGISQEHLYTFMDERSKGLRCKALLLCLLTELGERPTTPGACLAGLAAAHMDIRLQSAWALDQYAERKQSLKATTEILNDILGLSHNDQKQVDDQSVELVGETTVNEIAALLTQADNHIRLAICEDLLRVSEKGTKQEFDHWWHITQTRYTAEIKKAVKLSAKAKAGVKRLDLLPLAIGTYVGILRLKDSAARSQDRQTALKRLAGVASSVPEQAEAISTCLKVALYDRSSVVRDEAFERLKKITKVEDLAAEAIATEYRDIARKAMNLLLDKGKVKETVALLTDIQLTFTNGIEEEANEVLVAKNGLVKANSAALGARSESLRRLAVIALFNLYEKDDAARKQMYNALKSNFNDVKQRAALFLSKRQDKKALPALTEMLNNQDKKVCERAIKGFEALDDKSTAGLMLELLAKNEKHPLGKDILQAVSKLGDEKHAKAALQLLEHKNLRSGVYSTVLHLSGYDQRFKIVNKKISVEGEKTRPLNDKLLESLLKDFCELGESNLLARLIPIAAFCPLSAIDKHLENLSKFNDSTVRQAALRAAAMRLLKLNSKAETLRTALGHPDADSKFLAAEGLALAGLDDGVQVLLTGMEMLQDLKYRERCVLALGKLANPQALDQLLRLAGNEEHALQESAVEAIGYMKDSEQANHIYELLKKFVKGDQSGLKLRALDGLRWFDAPEGWQLIREQAKEYEWRVQDHAIELLAYDSDKKASIACLSKLIDDEYSYSTVRCICRSLQKLCGEDSLEALYIFLLSPAQYAVENVAPKYLKRLCKEGDAARLLLSLEKIDDEDIYDEIKEALLSRDPLPAKEALGMLPKATCVLADVILQILGRAKYKIPLKELEVLADKTWKQWVEQISDDSSYDEETYRSLLARIAWVSGQLALTPKIFADILENEETLGKSIRLAVLQALGNCKVGKELLPILIKLASHGESEIRTLASSLLQSIAPKEAAAIIEELLDTPQALLQVAHKQQLLKQPELLAKAALNGTLLQSFAVEDIDDLSKALKKGILDEQATAAILELLGHMKDEKAEKFLTQFATDKKQKDELCKLAVKLQRRSERLRSKQQPSLNWLEVTV